MQQRRLLPAARQTTLDIFSEANVPNPLASDGNVLHNFCPLIGQTLGREWASKVWGDRFSKLTKRAKWKRWQ